MATSFTSSLLSLYPRETDELTALLSQENVPTGHPENIFTFPGTLTANASLQRALAIFVQEIRTRSHGPVSLNAMLHLMVTTIGGPKAAYLGPEVDSATVSIQTFLIEHGHWPEIDSQEFKSADAPSLSEDKHRRPERRVHSFAASLASQVSTEENSSEVDDHASLAEIARALARLEQSQLETTRRLDALSERLERVGQNKGMDLVPLNQRAELMAVEVRPADSIGQNAPSNNSQNAFLPGDDVRPSEALSSAQTINTVDTVLPMPSSLVQQSPPNETADHSAVPQGRRVIEGSLNPREQTPAPKLADQEPTLEWKELFSAPARPRRSAAPIPFLVLAVIVILIMVAVIVYLRSRAEPVSSAPEVVPAAAATLPQQPETPSGASSLPTESLANHERAGVAPVASEKSSAGEHAVERVLGARERYQARESAESLEPEQPAFVAASTMETHLIYAPQPQHPRVPGLAGLSGMVVMELVIDQRGTVDNVRVLGGHHLLRDAAVNAVRNWRYRPFLRDGRPITVRTTVRLDFSPQGQTAEKK